jgi:hypothetical protein
MALALSVWKNGDDYVLVEHDGSKIRIGIHQPQEGDDRKATLILMADDGSGEAPDKTWLLLRKAVRERDDG